MVIAPFKTGLDYSVEPWLIPPDGLIEATNIHVRNGVIEKRGGYKVFGSLSSNPVMGIYIYVTLTNDRQTIAFDTERAYLYNTVTQVFDVLDAANIMSGSSTDYVWAFDWSSTASTLYNRLYFTNGKNYDGVSLDGIRYYPKSQAELDKTDRLSITIDAGATQFVFGCKLIFALSGRLVLLSTFEGSTPGLSVTYSQRARWCALQNPDNWVQNVPGGGNFADAATGDDIVSAQLLQNQIIVFFTNSVWTLVPISDPNKPFRWVKLNNFRACDGKMASVGYDRYVNALGFRGIVACDGNGTQRIDQRIPYFSVNEINANQFSKVFCQRDYSNRRWLTLYASRESTENNSVLVYDDDSGAFTTYDLSLHCLGQGNNTVDYAFSDFTAENGLDITFDGTGDDTFQSYYWSGIEDTILGGTIDGKILELNVTTLDIETPVNASFHSASWNPFQQEGVEAQMSYLDMYVDVDYNTVLQLDFFKNDEDTPYASKNVRLIPNLSFVQDIVEITQSNPAVVTATDHGLQNGDIIYIYGVLGSELSISAITRANPAVVTVNDIGDLQNGESIIIEDVSGMTQVNFDGSNPYTVANISGNTFELSGIDSSAYGIYVSGGNILRGMQLLNGRSFSITVIDENTFELDDFDSSLYPPYIGGGQLFFREIYSKKTWVRAFAGGIGYLHSVRVSTITDNSTLRLHSLKPSFRKVGTRTVN